jgi:TM2 domain-containing membrane protein YozV
VPWKSTGIAYVLLLLWGALGIHRFYLRSVVVGVVMLALWLVGSMFSLLGALMRAQEAAAAVTASLGGAAGPTLESAIPTPVLTAVGALLLAVLLVWLLFDLCTLPSLVHVINQKRTGQAIGDAVAVPSREDVTLAH